MLARLAVVSLMLILFLPGGCDSDGSDGSDEGGTPAPDAKAPEATDPDAKAKTATPEPAEASVIAMAPQTG